MLSDGCVHNILCFMLTYYKEDDIIDSVGFSDRIFCLLGYFLRDWRVSCFR